jgi:hypothetical protein
VNDTTSSKNNAKAKPLPTLFASESKLMLPAQDDDRILASLDGRAADVPTNGVTTSKAKLFLVGLLLSLLAVAAWLYANNFGNVRNRSASPATQVGVVAPRADAPVIASNSPANTPEPAAVSPGNTSPSQAPIAVAAAGSEAAPAPTAATIVNESSSPKVAEKTVQPAAKATRQSDPIQELIERSQRSEKNAAGSAGGPVKVARNGAAAPAMKMRGGQAFEPSAPSATATRNDSDIDLLAALFAHGEGKAALRSTPVLAPSFTAPNAASSQRSAPVALASNAYTEQRANPYDPAKDIVTAAPGASTQELVKRCRSLGWLEGELCRYRICSNQWGKDAACPLNNTASNSAYK